MPETTDGIHYQIRRHPRAKNMRLSVKPEGSVFLTLPKGIPLFLGKIFVQKNADWIKDKQTKFSRDKLPIKSEYINSFKTGDRLCFFDQKIYTIKIIKTLKKRSYYEFDEDVLMLHICENSQCLRLIESFYKDQARDYLLARSAYFSDLLGSRFNQMRIKNTQSRWGSCSSKKNLNYNWRIMLAPKEVIDYLVIHEVCHLKQMNHSAAFWALVEKLDPSFKDHKKWLRDNQSRLFNFLVI